MFVPQQWLYCIYRRTQKAVQQVPMRCLDFNSIISCEFRMISAFDKILYDFLYLIIRHLPGTHELRRRYGLSAFAVDRIGLEAGMFQLEQDLRAEGMNDIRHVMQGRDGIRNIHAEFPGPFFPSGHEVAAHSCMIRPAPPFARFLIYGSNLGDTVPSELNAQVSIGGMTILFLISIPPIRSG